MTLLSATAEIGELLAERVDRCDCTSKNTQLLSTFPEVRKNKAATTDGIPCNLDYNLEVQSESV
jgi:hypothetical protein